MRVAKTMSVAPKITLDQIREFTAAERLELGSVNGTSVTPKLEKVIKFLKTFEMSSADKMFVLQHVNDSGSHEKAFTHTVSYMNSHGGNQQVNEKEVTFVSVTGEEMSRPNTVIPMPFDVPPKRPLIQRVAVAVGTFTKISQGKLIPYVNMKEALKAWKGSFFRPAGIPILQNCWIDIAMADPAFLLRLDAKSAISADEYLVLIPQILNRCPMKDFIAMNQIVVYQLFEFFSQRVAEDGVVEYRRKMVVQQSSKPNEKPKKVPLIPEKNLMTLNDVFLTLSEAQVKEFDKIRREIGVPCLYFIRDYIDPTHTFQDIVGTMDAVVKGFQLGNLLRGSEDVATSRLYEQLGFSGLSDDFEKNVCLSLALALGAHAQLKSMGETPYLDIKLNSVGEAPIMHNSLRQHLPEDKNWRLVLPEEGDFVKVHPGLHSYCVDRSRVEACYIRVSPLEFGTLPTLGDYRVKCSQDLPGHKPKYYVLYTPVYGPYWWQTAKSAEQEKSDMSLGSSNSFIPVLPPPRPVQVYRYGSSARLKAIVTDLPALSLVGMKNRSFVAMKLEKMVTEEMWYKQVLMSMADKNGFFINPYSHFSPISNLPIASKTSVIFSRVSLVAQDEYMTGDLSQFEVDDQSDSDGEGWVRASDGEDDDVVPESTSDPVEVKASTSAPDPPQEEEEPSEEEEEVAVFHRRGRKARKEKEKGPFKSRKRKAFTSADVSEGRAKVDLSAPRYDPQY